jgi:hypothetical protein
MTETSGRSVHQFAESSPAPVLSSTLLLHSARFPGQDYYEVTQRGLRQCRVALCDGGAGRQAEQECAEGWSSTRRVRTDHGLRPASEFPPSTRGGPS